MAFINFADGDDGLADVVLNDIKHVNFGNTLLPVDTNGNGIDSNIDFGSIAYRFNGGFINYLGLKTVVVSTTPYTVTNASFILANATSGELTINLPASATLVGRQITIIKTESSSNFVVVDPNASETINGLSTFILPFQYDKLTIIADGIGWIILEELSFKNRILGTFSIPMTKSSTTSTTYVEASFQTRNGDSSYYWPMTLFRSGSQYKLYLRIHVTNNGYTSDAPDVRLRVPGGATIFEKTDLGAVNNLGSTEIAPFLIDLQVGNATNLEPSVTGLKGVTDNSSNWVLDIARNPSGGGSGGMTMQFAEFLLIKGY